MRINILIIEDEKRKADGYKKVLNEVFGEREWAVQGSFNSAMHAVAKADYDLVLLDITLKNFDAAGVPGGDSMGLGGRDIIREIEIVRPEAKVIVITQFRNFGEMIGGVSFDDLRAEISAMCPAVFYGMIQYHFDSSDWAEELSGLLKKACNEDTNC